MGGDWKEGACLRADCWSSTCQQYYEQAAKFLLAEGDAHWACRYPGIVRELLWLWRFREQRSVQFLQTTLAAQVSQCINCAVALRTARVAALDAACAADASVFNAAGSTADSAALRDAVRAWDVARLTAAFEQAGKTDNKHGAKAMQGALSSHVEVLLQPQLLLLDDEDGRRFNHTFSASLAALVRGDFAISGPLRLPGLYLLCVHSNSDIQSWARVQVRSLGTLEHPAHFEELLEVFDELVRHCERLTMIRTGCYTDAEVEEQLPRALSDDEREVWTGLSAAIAQLAPWIVRDQLLPRYGSLLPLAYMLLVENSPAMLPTAKCLHIFLRCLGSSFWQLPTCSFSPAGLRRVLEQVCE